MNLVGTWTLEEYVVELENGDVIKPWGDDFCGITLITEDGFISSSMVRANVDDELAEESFFSYTGQFDVEGNVIRIRVVLCSVPSWVGSVQERVIEVDGDLFTAVIPKMEWEGITGKNMLTWKRINP